MKSKSENEDFCPVARVAELLGDTCTLLIVRDLIDSGRRFKDLEASLHPISSRTITKKLRALEEKNIIIRTEFKERPPRVLYELTKEGRHLHTLIDDMRSYGKKFLTA